LLIHFEWLNIDSIKAEHDGNTYPIPKISANTQRTQRKPKYTNKQYPNITGNNR
jgi:hypothetical protein